MADKKSGKPGKLVVVGKELLAELRKDPGYRVFQDSEELRKQLGSEISRVRKAKRISPAEFAKRINKEERVVQRMEKGEFKQYNWNLLLQIARALDSRIRFQLTSE